jgi:hypothetical protein
MVVANVKVLDVVICDNRWRLLIAGNVDYGVDGRVCWISVPECAKVEVIGQVIFHSSGLSATRVSKAGLQCIMDYTACTQPEDPTPKPNITRMVNKESRIITSTCQVRPNILVSAVGRTSSVQIGRVRKELSLVKGQWSDTEYTKTFEWTVVGRRGTNWRRLEPRRLGDKRETRSRWGDMESNSLCEQVWGTQGQLPRVEYVTAWEEIVDDIEEKHVEIHGLKLRATLPQSGLSSTCQIG